MDKLEPIAMAALEAGRMLMGAGANAGSVQGVVEMVARGLGAERVDLRIGYASLAVTVGVAGSNITRMRKIGPLGVNQRLGQSIWELAQRVARGELTTKQTHAGLVQLARETPRHGPWFTAVAVGLACAAFGRLLGVDWYGCGPALIAATVGQYTRGKLLKHHVNAYLCTGLISFLSSILGALLAWQTGSATLTTAAVASVLLLVPGVPAVNAQSDILQGHPTLGSARAVTVLMTLVFIAAGLWISRALLMNWGIV